MECPNCFFKNLAHSIYCQNCGEKLSFHAENQFQPDQLFNKIDNEISDILFTPKKKNSFLKFTLIGVLIIVIAVLLMGVYSIWLREQYSDSAVTANNTVPTEFPIADLKIEDSDLTWKGTALFFNGTIKNSYTKPAQNIKVRIDLYHDKETQHLFDTRYATIMGVPSDGAYTFDIPIYASPDGDFWWVQKIESADF